MERLSDSRLIAIFMLVGPCLAFVAQAEAGLPHEAKCEQSIVGAWITGEDIDVVFSFCEDGTFTKWHTYYYWKESKTTEVCKEKIACGVFTTGQDEVSHTIDLHFQSKNDCVALGRFAWSSDPSGGLDLNIAECGEPRPASPSYYLMRPGGNLDCTCLDENGCAIAEVQMTAFSGRFGYGLLGDYGFVGSLTKEQLTDPTWHLEGEFQFPTAGYNVGTPEVQIQESYPEQVSVMIDVTSPSLDSVVAQVITRVPVSLEITVSNEALFRIRTRTCDDGSEGEGEGEGEPDTPNNPFSIFGCYSTEKRSD